MSVCVFDPTTGNCFVDKVTMRGSVYSNGMRKLYQLAHNDRIYTLMCAGLSEAVSYALPVVAQSIITGKLDPVEHRKKFTEAIGDLQENQFCINVVEYDPATRSARYFTYSASFVPYEITWFDNELVICANPEIELALQMVYKWERFKHRSVSEGEIAQMIFNLRGHHVLGCVFDDVIVADVRKVSPEYAYDRYGHRFFQFT